MELYANDSFYTLTTWERVGLVFLSVALATGCVMLCRWLAKGRRGPVRIFVAFAIFAAFVALSPQVYYAYYQLIFQNLPSQWVVRLPEGLDLLQLLTFTGPANLSAHSQGVLGWLLGAVALRSPGSGTKP